jgi:hypothetical protein
MGVYVPHADKVKTSANKQYFKIRIKKGGNPPVLVVIKISFF